MSTAIPGRPDPDSGAGAPGGFAPTGAEPPTFPEPTAFPPTASANSAPADGEPAESEPAKSEPAANPGPSAVPPGGSEPSAFSPPGAAGSSANPEPSAVPPGGSEPSATPGPSAVPPDTPASAFPPPSPFAAPSGPFAAPSGPYGPYGPATPAGGGHSIDGYPFDGRTLDGQAPGGQTPGGQGLGGQAPGGQAFGGQAPDGQAAGGQAPGGQATGGQAFGGQASGGQGLGGQPTDPAALGPIPGPWPHYEPQAPKGPLDSVGARSLVALGVGLVVALLGFPLGWLWESVVPRVPVVRQGQEFFYADPYGEQRAAQEGWFILLSIGVGIVLAILCWVLLRRFRGAAIAVALGLGGTVAGWLAWRFGHTIGYAHNLALQRAAKDGQTVYLPPDLRVRQKGDIAFWHHLPYISGVLLYLGIAALAVYLLLVAFTANPDLRPRRRARGPQAPRAPELPTVS